MFNAGNANVTRLDNIYFLTADEMITKDGRQVVITQSFSLPQGQYPVICNNGNVHVTCGYIGVGPLALSPAIFKAIITDPTGINVPCEMIALVLGK